MISWAKNGKKHQYDRTLACKEVSFVKGDETVFLFRRNPGLPRWIGSNQYKCKLLAVEWMLDLPMVIWSSECVRLIALQSILLLLCSDWVLMSIGWAAGSFVYLAVVLRLLALVVLVCTVLMLWNASVTLIETSHQVLTTRIPDARCLSCFSKQQQSLMNLID